MGYRIDFTIREGTLRATVSGQRASRHAESIARDIAQEAGREGSNTLLVDLRRLDDRVGMLRTMLDSIARARNTKSYRVAVVDVEGNQSYYAFAELASRTSGYSLRYFCSPQEAMKWLQPGP
jgi:hypothetical protein